MSEALVKAPEGAEAQVAALEKLVSEAYKEIDSAASKGVIHANTAARRKARVAKYKQQVRRRAGCGMLRSRAVLAQGFAWLRLWLFGRLGPVSSSMWGRNVAAAEGAMPLAVRNELRAPRVAPPRPMAEPHAPPRPRPPGAHQRGPLHPRP